MIRIQILSEAERKNLKSLEEIRPAEKEKLTKLVKMKKKNWFDRANERSEKFKKDKVYDEKSGIWSEIKEVYMKLQFYKCAYCEQKLEDQNIVHDVEHFRPKKNVRIWLNETQKKSLGFDFADTESNGYYLLPYNIFNYVTTCKHCNSSIKSDFFPISGERKTDSDDFAEINALEKPFLIYPLGHIEEFAPEELIAFDGVLPIPHPKVVDEHQIKRVKVTIEFFNLAAIRDTLIEERCEVIKNVFNAVRIISKGEADEEEITEKKEELQIARSNKSPHSNCANSFFDLCMKDFERAREIAREAHIYLVKRRLNIQ